MCSHSVLPFIPGKSQILAGPGGSRAENLAQARPWDGQGESSDFATRYLSVLRQVTPFLQASVSICTMKDLDSRLPKGLPCFNRPNGNTAMEAWALRQPPFQKGQQAPAACPLLPTCSYQLQLSCHSTLGYLPLLRSFLPYTYCIPLCLWANVSASSEAGGFSEASSPGVLLELRGGGYNGHTLPPPPGEALFLPPVQPKPQPSFLLSFPVHLDWFLVS